MSDRKDRITTDNTQAERDRVRHEQDYIKHKGHEVASVAARAKEGHVGMPSNDSLTSALQHGQQSLDRMQQSDRGRQMNSGGDKIVEDVKRVLADQQAMISNTNDGDMLQNLVRDFWALLQELQQSSELKGYFEEWQGTVTGVFASGDFTQFFQQTGDLITSMRDTDEFLSLASELVDLMKIVVAEATEKIVDGDSATREEYKRQREMERRRVARELRYTLSSMTRNEMWRGLVQRGKSKAHQTKDTLTREINATHPETLFYNLRESRNFQRLLEDFRILLQRLVGNRMSVEPLFQYSKAALDDVADDDELSAVVAEMQRVLPAIAEDTALLDDANMQREIDSLSKRADDVIVRLKNNKNILGARQESLNIATALREEAYHAPLLTDLKTLWSDLSSSKDGEVIDPDVLRSLRQMIVPLLVEHLNNVPLPAVSDEASFLGKYFYTIDQMKISLPELIPENIHLRFEYEMDANPLELEAKNQHTFLYLQASHIQLHLHDCHFTYERRTIPKHSDSGIFDVDTVGEGLTAWCKMEIKTDTSKGQYLDVLRSDVKISKFHITFRDSKHDHLYEMVTHLFARKIRTAVIDMIQSKFKTFGSYFNTQILTLLDQAKSSSSSISKIARSKTDLARQGIEGMKLHAHEKKSNMIESREVQDTKEEAKSTAKIAVERASERIQERLNDTKVQIENVKREKELDNAIVQQPYSTSTHATATPYPTTTHATATPYPTTTPHSADTSSYAVPTASHSADPVTASTLAPAIAPGQFDPRQPFHSNTSSNYVPPHSPSILNNSSTAHYYSPNHNDESPFHNNQNNSLASESFQFSSPHYSSPAFGKNTADFGAHPSVPLTSPLAPSTAPSLSKNHNDESAWVSARPDPVEEQKSNVMPSL